MDHLMAENNENNKDSQKGQVTPKKNILKNSKGGEQLWQGGKNFVKSPQGQVWNPGYGNL